MTAAELMTQRLEDGRERIHTSPFIGGAALCARAIAGANHSKIAKSSEIPVRGGMKKQCTEQGCARLTEGGGKCPSCRTAADTARGTTAERGYARGWERVRLVCFIRDQWRCVDCKWEPDIVRMCREAGLPRPPADRILNELRLRFADGRTHLHADHLRTVEQAPELRLDLDNLRTRCNHCNVSRRNKGNTHGVPGPVEIPHKGVS